MPPVACLMFPIVATLSTTPGEFEMAVTSCSPDCIFTHPASSYRYPQWFARHSANDEGQRSLQCLRCVPPDSPVSPQWPQRLARYMTAGPIDSSCGV